MKGPQQVTRRRLASAVALAERAWHTFQRFPFAILSGIAAAVVLHHVAGIEFDPGRGADSYYPILMACILGIPVFTAIELLAESRGCSRTARLEAALVGLALLVAYYAVLPYPIRGAEVARCLLLIAGLHLLISFVPFGLRSDAENGFWQYNKLLLLRFILAALYTIVLWVGLSLALLACDTLLEIDVEPWNYVQLWYWIAFVYATWFFLTGIPEDVKSLEQVRDYPVGLRVFTQYVLIPLVVVYFIILYAYTAKIIIQWSLPEGWVGYPVIGVSVTGMLALLLVHPIRERAESAWIASYAKYFYWALYPLIALLIIAIATRIADYGVTERRYLVVVATAWLLGIALYFSFGRRKDIRAIPISLCIGTFLTTFGPWSATSVSRRSQLGRLREILVREEVMVDGRLDSIRKRVDFERESEISDIVRYLHDVHGIARIRDWYAQPERLPDEASPQLALQEMGLLYRSRWEERDEFAIRPREPNPLALDGFDYLYRISASAENDTLELRAPLDSLTELYLDGSTLHLGRPDDPTGRLVLELAPTILDLRERERRDEPYGPEASTLDVENARYRLVLHLAEADGYVIADSVRLSRLSATALITRK